MGDRSKPAPVTVDDRASTLLLLHDPLSPIPDPLPEPGAHDRDRTGDLVLTKDVLYRLSYVGGRSSKIITTQLQPPPSHLERVVGIEPTSSAWKAEVLPLNYTRQAQLTATAIAGIRIDSLKIPWWRG